MDQTEVTEGQYRAWLDTEPRTDMQPAYCSTNITFWNAAREQPDPGSTLPVVLVDWCDALAFCTAAGKRLCSRVGGGGLAYVLRGPIDSLESEWFVACTNQGATRFPYGDIYDAELCNGMDAPGDMRVAVGDLPGCRSTSGIVHLSGNVYEWEDACDGMTGASDSCHRRGGSYRSLEDNMSCDGNDSVNFTRLDDTGDTTGIRCCADSR